MQASEGIAEVLVREGVTHVFGVPGGYTVRVLDGLYDVRDQVTVVRAPHEQTASCMADVYGRRNGKPAVLIGQGAFIGSSGAFGIMEAFLASSPMLVITDTSDYGITQHASFQAATGEYGAIDLPGILRGMTKYCTVATTPNEAVHGVELAIAHATSGRPGPAAVVLRGSVFEGETDPESAPRLHGLPRVRERGLAHPSTHDVTAVAESLRTAERPVLIAGNGVLRAKASDALAAVAERAGTPVITSVKAKGALSERHQWSAGPIGGFGTALANHTLASADTVIVLGSRLNPADTFMESPWLIDPSRQHLIQIDVEPQNLGWCFPVERGILADVGVFLDSLLEELTMEADVLEQRAAAFAAQRAEHEEAPPELYESRSPLPPQRLVEVLNQNLSEDANVVLDAGNNRIFMYHFFKVTRPGSLFVPGGIAGMGWSAGAALAAALLEPDRPTLAVIGDGGFLMATHVLSTAVEYALPLTILVMNNSGLMNVQDVQRGRHIATDFPPTDFATIARAYGAEGQRIETDVELAQAIKASTERSGPTVLDVATDPQETFKKIAQRDPSRQRSSAKSSPES